MRKTYALFVIILFCSSCYRILSSSGGGEDVKTVTRVIDPADVAVPDGYVVEVIAQGLTFPTGIAFDENNVAYVTESGYSYGEVFKAPRLIRIGENGEKEIVLTGENNGPWNGVYFDGGYFYIAEGGQLSGGRILKADRTGNITVLIDSLPSLGDHHTNGPVVHNGYVYFGQGTATNSGVVGKDNFEFGWLKRYPQFHDVPCRDIKLAGINYTSKDVLNETGNTVTTGAFLPYGTASQAGQVISGKVPCSGAILRVPVEGGEPELVAWGFRNPYGLAMTGDGELYITENGYDDRGSRPVWGTGDHLWKVEEGKWYGWPDHSGGVEITSKGFKVPGKEVPKKVLAENPALPPHSAARLGVHSSSNGFDFSRSNDFGYAGEAFIAQFGDMAPDVGKVLEPVGFKVVKADPRTGVVKDFVVNKKSNGPASKLGTGGLERPIAVRFSPDGREMYIVDFGIMQMTEQGPLPIEASGVIWKIYKR